MKSPKIERSAKCFSLGDMAVTRHRSALISQHAALKVWVRQGPLSTTNCNDTKRLSCSYGLWPTEGDNKR